MALKPLIQNRTCVLKDAEVDGGRVRVRYSPLRGSAEIVDWLVFEPRGQPQAVNSVGRFLRILRAGRIRPPDDPYALGAEPGRAADLLQRCAGTKLKLRLRQRIERTLSVWTEAGVDRFERVIDVDETRDALVVRRTGGRSALRIPRDSLVRFELTSVEKLEVISVEAPAE